MSEIKALEKLYKLDIPDRYGIELYVKEAADEIQAEVDSRFIELPVDADGVPIRVGDNLECDDGKFLCNGIKLYHNRWWVMHDNDLSSSRWARCCHHVKQRTLEDVLTDVVTLCANTWKDGESPFAFYDISDVMESGNMREYADEIRELLGGDAE